MTFLIVCTADVLARPVLAFTDTNWAKGDTLNYWLYIPKSKIPLLKDTIFNREKCFITQCPLMLYNNTSDTLKYMTMSASWWDIYYIDNQNFALAADWWNVFKNSSQLIVLPPHQSITRSIGIITYKGYYRGQKLRIAMSLQRIGFELPGFMVQLKPKTTNMIWSNQVTLN